MKDGRARGKYEGNVARMNRWEVEVNRTTHKRTMDGTYMSIGHGLRFKERRPGDDDPAAADHQLLIVRVAPPQRSLDLGRGGRVGGGGRWISRLF